MMNKVPKMLRRTVRLEDAACRYKKTIGGGEVDGSGAPILLLPQLEKDASVHHSAPSHTTTTFPDLDLNRIPRPCRKSILRPAYFTPLQ
jgi:hypothetical protein